jgi:hypothetical protein
MYLKNQSHIIIKRILGVAMHPLDGHELIDYQESNPQQVPHIHSQDEDPSNHELH